MLQRQPLARLFEQSDQCLESAAPEGALRSIDTAELRHSVTFTVCTRDAARGTGNGSSIVSALARLENVGTLAH